LGDTEVVVRRSAGRRRRFSKEFKRQVVQETLAGDASVAGVALRHRLNANQVFTWRRKYLGALATSQANSVKLLPVTIADAGATVPAVAAEPVVGNKPVRRYRVRGAIEIEINGARIVLKGAVDGQALRVVLEALVCR
jgi:transposase